MFYLDFFNYSEYSFQDMNVRITLLSFILFKQNKYQLIKIPNA